MSPTPAKSPAEARETPCPLADVAKEGSCPANRTLGGKSEPQADWVSTEKAGKILGMKPTSTWKWLNRKVTATRLRVVSSGSARKIREWSRSAIESAMEAAPPDVKAKPEPMLALDVSAHREAWAARLRSMPKARRRRLFNFAQEGARWLLSPATCERLMDLDPASPDEDDD